MTRENFIKLLEEAGWTIDSTCIDFDIFKKRWSMWVYIYDIGFEMGYSGNRFTFSMHNLQQFFHAANLHERLQKVE